MREGWGGTRKSKGGETLFTLYCKRKEFSLNKRGNETMQT